MAALCDSTVKRNVVMEVKFFNVTRRFGKLKNDEFNDVFIHKSDILDCGGQYTSNGDVVLYPLQKVTCDVALGEKGHIAKNVKVSTAATNVNNYSQVIEEDLRGEIFEYDHKLGEGVISSRQYGRVCFKKANVSGPGKRLIANQIVSFDLHRLQRTLFAVNVTALGGTNENLVSNTVIERNVRGKVCKVIDSYGFIHVGNRDAFFHKSDVRDGNVRVGSRVRCDITPGSKGPNSYQAVNVQSLDDCGRENQYNTPSMSRSSSTASLNKIHSPSLQLHALPQNPRPQAEDSNRVEYARDLYEEQTRVVQRAKSESNKLPPPDGQNDASEIASRPETPTLRQTRSRYGPNPRSLGPTLTSYSFLTRESKGTAVMSKSENSFHGDNSNSQVMRRSPSPSPSPPPLRSQPFQLSSSEPRPPRPPPRRSPPPPPKSQPTLPPYASMDDPTRPNEERFCHCCEQPPKWPLETPCGHVFCRTCIERWLKFMKSCPLSSCQKDLVLHQLKASP